MDNHQHAIGKDFILGGRAIFTVASPTGERYTFKVTRKDADPGSRYQQPTYFLAVMTGSANDADSSYTYLGILLAGNGGVKLTRNSRMADDATQVRVVRWALAKVWAGQALPTGYAIHHEGRCGRCGRLLTVPESITTGFGPECSERMGLAPKAAPALPLSEVVKAFAPMDSVDRAEIALGVQ